MLSDFFSLICIHIREFDMDVFSICVSEDDSMLYAVGLVDDFELLSYKIKI